MGNKVRQKDTVVVFYPSFLNSGHLERYTLPVWDVCLQDLVENKSFHFLRRALGTGAARKKCYQTISLIKKPWYFQLFVIFIYNSFILIDGIPRST